MLNHKQPLLLNVTACAVCSVKEVNMEKLHQGEKYSDYSLYILLNSISKALKGK